MPLYALLKQGNEKIIKNVILSEQDFIVIERRFLKGFSFYENLLEKAVSYNEDWLTDQESVYRIDNYVDDNNLKTFQDSSVNSLVVDDYKSIVCLFIKHNGNILIQHIDSRNIIYPEKHGFLYKRLVSDESNYVLNNSLHGFFVSENVHAVINDHLFFHSFYLADKALDLSKYMIEASDEQVKEFFYHNLIQMDCDLSDLIHEQNKILRSDIGRIIQSGILDRYSAKYFKEKAESIKDTKNIPLEIKDNKIVIPVKKSDRNEVLKFLKNTIVQSVLDGELYRTNSKRLLVSG